MSNWNHGNVTGRINPVQVLGRSGDLDHLDPRNQPASLLQLVTKDSWESKQFPMPFRCLKNLLKSRSREHWMHPFKPILMKSLVVMVKKPGKLTYSYWFNGHFVRWFAHSKCGFSMLVYQRISPTHVKSSTDSPPRVDQLHLRPWPLTGPSRHRLCIPSRERFVHDPWHQPSMGNGVNSGK